ncbi:cytochrome b [Mycobacterium sp. CBMA293]|uniref:cytochrome b n=1 Tax=unclassified Mycolicibacterium TaxID=2636767 RepID=UPI00132C8FEE|nr:MULTISPECIES: cytochrome b/b6 domain-containing protein [unclassified Mycolicibacterium]MUL47975.1 cytochrome b [Mycolicibacterium sp. CBMA 360]MUL93036.1 cytochrome b [Mycolicibacterium sp. CBMA 230]MUM33613.1 cytochrome b [Mycolicibacterium sp. CBMA 361]MUL58153.1 cytochrome b [Mycolicibacterium sp. CBMA 335]MUL73611.1 cytochrome b [Mycolicibacterium sp. CBMA 311]
MTGRFPVRSRVLHWLTAVAIFAALLIGFTMTNEIGSHHALVAVHMTLGISILAIVIVRAANRFTHKPPNWPDTVGRLEGKLIARSEQLMYAMMLAQPLIGWAMVSASGTPIRVFGAITLPPIAPFDADLYGILRQAHSVVAYLLVAAVAAHVSAILLHTLTLRDGMLRRMTH